MTDEQKPADDFMEIAAAIAMEWIDITPFARALQKQYQQGFDAGLAASGKAHAVASQAEYQRGYDAARADIFRAMQDVRRDSPAEKPKEPIVSDIQEVEPKVPAEPEPDPPKGSDFVAVENGAAGDLVRVAILNPGDKVTDDNGYAGTVDESGIIRFDKEKPTSDAANPVAKLRGDNLPPRPDIPTTFEMVAIVLDEMPSLNAQQVVERIRDRWWPDLEFKRVGPELSTWVRKGRLDRDADGKLILSNGGRRLAFPIGDMRRNPLEIEASVLPKAPVRAPMPAVRPTEGPRREVVTPGAKLGPPARQEGATFSYNGRIVVMHPRQQKIAQHLVTAMGKGHLDARFLGDAIGVRSEPEMHLRELIAIMNPKIAELGLSIEFFKGFGFIMKEVG